ncbi:MAG: hypothetical protein IT324_17655 [Anaerolineae bacterium]|nr:hypothetical protein [Anaerolineae bacterium]
MRRLSFIVTLIAVLILAALPAAAQTPPPTPNNDPLLAMLALIPDSPTVRVTQGFGVSYADYRAIEAAHGFTRPAPGTDFASLSEDQQELWFYAMGRVRSGTPLSYVRSYLSDAPRLVGFSWFDVDRALEYGVPPHTVKIFGGTFDADKISVALSARDFEKMDVDGVTVWHRFEDARTNLTKREVGDPFGGELGMAARIALLPGHLANARYWDDVNAVVAAYKGSPQSLADALDYRALTEAITDSASFKGALLQAIFIPAEATEGIGLAPADQMPNAPDLNAYQPLPSYQLAVIADRQEGDTQVNLIAAAYSDESTAQQASTELHKRIVEFNIGKRYDLVKATVDARRIYKAANGLNVVVIAVRYPLQAYKPDAKPGENVQGGLVYALWVQSMTRRQFYPLALKLPKQ